MEQLLQYQYLLVIGASLILFFLSPLAKNVQEFFSATVKNRQPNAWVLTSSLVISWIFAKSITNAANLGMSYGFVGGVSYAIYYLSFLVAGVFIYQLRTKGNFGSIHQFLGQRFGKSAVLIFSLLIAFRLFNEVWSNTMVIGSYFGEQGSYHYYLAILVFTLLTLAYTLKGGLRSSLLTDVIQMALFSVLLVVLLGVILPKQDYQIGRMINSGSWSPSGGIFLLFAALIQVFSYPFHDPVLTDRAFISSPKVTRRSFFWASIIGMLCIVLFSFVGIHGQMEGLEGQAPVVVSRSLGVPLMLIMNFIMITSAASTLDSTFSSFAKLTVMDLGLMGRVSIPKGRLAMLIITLLGTFPIFLNATILSATTISGTMVIGLAPVFLFWKRRSSPLAFHLSVGSGVVMGMLLATDTVPESWVFLEGPYASLLCVNIIGTVLSFTLFLVASQRKKIAHEKN